MPPSCRLILIAGVSGSGKTTVGDMLSTQLGWEFHDGDGYHSPENVAKMATGHPLTDADREPWLASIHAAMGACLREGRGAVFACSALKESYRRTLLDGLDGAGLVFLHGDFKLLRSRMEARKDHYMKADMLRSQCDIAEVPEDALPIDAQLPPFEAVRRIRAHFGL